MVFLFNFGLLLARGTFGFSLQLVREKSGMFFKVPGSLSCFLLGLTASQDESETKYIVFKLFVISG